MLAALAYEDAYPNGLYFEPHEGALKEAFASSDEPVRILDLGRSPPSDKPFQYLKLFLTSRRRLWPRRQWLDGDVGHLDGGTVSKCGSHGRWCVRTATQG